MKHDLIWARLRVDERWSWHPLRFDDPTATVCGLEVSEEDETRDELGTEKSCENCLRILARRADQGTA